MHPKKLATLAAAFVGLVLTAGANEPAPNILFLFTDDQSFRTLSCYPGAYNYAHTPNIDSLAKKGVRFEHAYIGAKCVPSRAGMLTGRFQYACAEGEPYKWWTTALRTEGYYTGMIGKWHWGKGTEAHKHGTAWDWSVVWDHGGYAAAGGYYHDQKVVINGGEPTDLGGYSTDRYTELTVNFINERAKDPGKPWFHWLCYAAVHGPYTPAERHKELYLDKPPTEIPEDIYGPRPGKPVHMQGSSWKRGENGEPLFKGKTLDFWAKQQNQAVAAIDESIGRITKALEETGQLENTIIVFTSDQGYVWGHHGLKGKIWPYAAAIRSPLIVSCPKRYPAGKVCKTPVNGMDLIRTFHSMAGAEPDQLLHGRDFTPLLAQPESPEVAAEWNRTPTMMTYTRNTYSAADMAEKLKEKSWSSFQFGSWGKKGSLKGDNPGDNYHPCYFMTVDGRHKYIRYIFPNRIEELYDLEKDPEEMNNLAVDPKFEGRLAEMREGLVEYLRKTGGESFVDLLPAPKIGQSAQAPIAGAEEEEKPSEAAKVSGDTTVYHLEGKNRVHVKECKRLAGDMEKMTKMTLAEAEAKGLPLCSRCPGSTTPGKGNP